MVESVANYLLFHDGLNRKVGLYFTCQCFDCHPKYFKRKQKRLAVERKNAHNLINIEECFEIFCKLVKLFGLTPKDISNMDETGFRIGCSKT